MTVCTACHSELAFGVTHYCAGTKPHRVTREEFESLREAVTSLMTSMSIPVRDAAFARGATDALGIRVASLERVTNAIWTCADKDTERIDALARHVGFREQENTSGEALSPNDRSGHHANTPGESPGTEHTELSKGSVVADAGQKSDQMPTQTPASGSHFPLYDGPCAPPAASALPPLPERPWQLFEYRGASGRVGDFACYALALESHLAAAKAEIADLRKRNTELEFRDDMLHDIEEKLKCDREHNAIDEVCDLLKERDTLKAALASERESRVAAEKRAERLMTREEAVQVALDFAQANALYISGEVNTRPDPRAFVVQVAALRSAETKETKDA